jgi:GNAT superfamily N-acetyltransferase
VAVNEQGFAAGIVCVVGLSDKDNDALLWLEVLPQYRGQGIGKALLLWAKGQTRDDLVIKSVPTAAGFYLRHA